MDVAQLLHVLLLAKDIEVVILGCQNAGGMASS